MQHVDQVFAPFKVPEEDLQTYKKELVELCFYAIFFEVASQLSLEEQNELKGYFHADEPDRVHHVLCGHFAEDELQEMIHRIALPIVDRYKQHLN